jgi:SSS family transporter
MGSLRIADIAVLVAYMVIIIAIGAWTSIKIKSSGDFFMPRKFGKIMMTMFSFGSGTHSDQAVYVASKSYTNGLSGIWYEWLWLFATPFYWLIAPVMRRLRAITTADVFENRYNSSVAILFAVSGILNLVVCIGLMLKGSGVVISSSIGGALNPNYVIIIMTAIFVLYGVAGGLAAAIVTDFIQGVLTIIFSFMLLPLVMEAIGGMEGLRQGLANSPNMLSLVAPEEIGFFYIAIISLNALAGIVTQPHTMGNCAAGKTEMEGRVGFMTGPFIKRFCTIPWCLTGLAAVVYFAGKEIAPDHVYGAVASEFLPKLMPGVLGIFIAAILASVMSTCDALMISSSALFTENIYTKCYPGKSQKHYILVGRIAAIAVVAGSLIFAYYLESLVKGLEIFWKVSSMMAVAFWMGLFWRRATSAGAWASTIGFALAWYLTSRPYLANFLSQYPIAHSMRFIIDTGKGPEIYLPWQLIAQLGGGLIIGIIVSLLTRPINEKKLDNFYALIRTPIQPGEVITKSCTLPEGVVVPPKRCIFPDSSLEIMIPSKTSVIGFLAGWLAVAVIIYIVYLIARG